MNVRTQRGFTLMETMVAVAIAGFASAIVIIALNGRKPESGTSAISTMLAAMQSAESIAKASTGGSTLVIQPSVDGEYEATVYAGVPGNGFRSTPALAPLTIPAQLSVVPGHGVVTTARPIAIFVSHYGDATIMNWDPASGTTPSISDCAGDLRLALTSRGNAVGTIHMTCGDATFVPYDAHGNPLKDLNGNAFSG